MRKPPIIDAEFEVISGPGRPVVRWQPRQSGFDPFALVRWTLIGLVSLAALVTAIAGFSGGDIDTRQPDPLYEPGRLADGRIAVQPID